MPEIKAIENIDRVDWHDLLANSSTASYFQTPECYDFFCSLSFLETFGWGVYENGQLKVVVTGYITANGGKIKQFFSRRAIIHGGVLLADDVTNKEIGALLQAVVKSLSKKVIYIEIRNNSNFSAYKRVFEKYGFGYYPHLNYLVDTSQPDKITSRYSESKVRQIRKAYEQGVVCESTVEQKDVDGFYYILEKLYKRKVKKPLFPKEFFEKLVYQESCKLFVVKKNNRVIGGIACASLPGKAVYEWFVCGDTKNFNYLYPSVIATHKGIEFAAENKFAYFDFMGAGKPDVEYGVRDFKERFGGKLYEWGRFRFVSNHFLYKIGQIVIETIGKS
ncbi:MAG: peptidoglycan bridge formation glycyltransferase FemA/FemB family protein [Bacteroidales bacterium]|nr:peptidoglycan bridge formation glycyltransferase FemA/FemB family protein [Bacteroidales bacterium]